MGRRTYYDQPWPLTHLRSEPLGPIGPPKSYATDSPGTKWHSWRTWILDPVVAFEEEEQKRGQAHDQCC